MEALAHMFVAATDLVEAEGRVLRSQLLRVAVIIVAGLLSIVLAFVGLGFLLYGILLYISQHLTRPGSAFIFGIITVVFAFGVLWTARKLLK